MTIYSFISTILSYVFTVIIWYENGEWYLEDLGSRNGTYVNGQRIRQEVILDTEDTVSLGGLNFVFET